MSLIGLDVGTTGCKATLFEFSGRLIGSVSREYAVDFPQPGWAEQDAEYVFELVKSSIKELMQAFQPHVEAIGLSVQGEAVIPVDEDGYAMLPAILGMDTRTSQENAWLVKHFGATWLFEHTGMPVHTINTLPKLLWLKEHHPQVWGTARSFLLYEDFFINKMTGKPAISRCLASRTQMFDLQQDGWSSDILAALELEPERLAPVLPSGTAVGEMTAGLANALGFANQPLIVTGGHDQACGALGVGLSRPGLAMVSTGTAEVVEVALASPVLSPTLAQGNISVYAHGLPGLYLAMTLNHSGGLLLRWYRDTFAHEELRLAIATQRDAYDLIFGDLPPGPSPLLLLPHFSGSGTPTFDTQSMGALVGLTFSSSRQDLAKAILEGLTFELRWNLDVLREGGVALDELRAIGGGARSKTWLQLKADITGVRVVVPRITEAASWGAAVLAGVGAGVFREASLAVEAALHIEQVYEPEPSRQQVYQERYLLYRELYPALKSIHHRLTGLQAGAAYA